MPLVTTSLVETRNTKQRHNYKDLAFKNFLFNDLISYTHQMLNYIERFDMRLFDLIK